MVPITGNLAHSLYFWIFKNQVQRMGTQQQQLPKVIYNIVHRLQVHHLTLTVIIHNKCNTLYLLRASERSERSEHTVVLSSRFLSIYIYIVTKNLRKIRANTFTERLRKITREGGSA